MHATSRDNLWPFEVVHDGVPALVFLAGAVLWIAVRMARLGNLDPVSHRCRAAWLITIAGLAVAGATVHFWNAILCLFFFVLGSGVWLIERKPHKTPGS